MDIKFLDREMKNKKLEVSTINYCYLMAIKSNNPEIWKQFKELIERVEGDN